MDTVPTNSTRETRLGYHLRVAKIQQSCYVPRETYDKLDTLARETNRSVSRTLADIVAEYFEDEGDEPLPELDASIPGKDVKRQ